MIYYIRSWRDIISAGAGDNTITSGAGADSITVAGSGADGAGNIIDAGSGNDTVVMSTVADDDTVTLGTGDDTLDARLTTTSTEKVVVTDFEDAGVTVGDTVILAQSLTTKDATGTPLLKVCCFKLLLMVIMVATALTLIQMLLISCIIRWYT